MLTITPYIVGKLYRVPVVRGSVRIVPGGEVLFDWPVLGPKHEDREYIKFPHDHWHLDHRFLPERLLSRMRAEHKHVEAAYNIVMRHGYFRQPEFLGYRLRKCRRHWPEYPRIYAPWLRELEAAYANATVGPGLVCPHRGAPLEGLEVKDGCVTCPLHGLRWDVETGSLAKEKT